MKRLCLDCGLIFDVKEQKRLFKKKGLGQIPRCEYCRGQKNIDITDSDDIAPFILKMTEIGYNVTGHTIERNEEDGKYSFGIMVTDESGVSYKDLDFIFDNYGSGMKYCYFHPLNENDNINYIVGASFSYAGSFSGHISSKYSKDMIFTSYEFITEYANMIKEFSTLLERVMDL